MSGILRIVSVTALLSATLPQTLSTPLPDRVYVRNATTPTHHNKTIADLVQRQTDTIKQIVSTHRLDYPVITKYPAENKRPPPDDAISLDELKTKCQHLARLLSTSTTPTPRPNATGFYITTEEPPPTTPRPTSASASPVKYIKLEPVILQKTIMSDGRTIFYWHKSIPSQIAPAAVPTPPSTTTTTPAPGYNFRNFFPSFYSIGGSEPAPATTTEKASTAPDELSMYQQQLKFVVPVPYAPPDDPGLRRPWDFDQYAYYPRPLQPESVNMQVPYVPSFHVIKAIAVPNQYDNENV